jgi:hypothetical protein
MSIHVTPIPRLTNFGAPAFTLGTANSAGDSKIAVSSNSTLLTYDTTAPASVSTANQTGSASTAARRDHIHDGGGIAAAAKGWAYVTVSGGSPTLAANLNVSGIVDSDVGRFDVTWDTDFSSVNYAVVGMSGSTTFIGFRDVNVAGTSYVITNDAAGSAKDPANWSVVAYGAQ